MTEIEFNRPNKYTRVKTLGSGACGNTVLLRDEGMDCEFVAKKYSPFFPEKDNESLFAELLRRFRDEARILFRLNHPNIVRVFQYFDYPEYKTAYIIMEHVSGSELLDYLKENPAKADQVFEAIVDGFAHLQKANVLHRDIRPANIMVDGSGVPKIIDFGFGKVTEGTHDTDNEKSISLNWWCETPPEFAENIYDFQTEVYFVGKLFQLAIEQCNLSDFKYRLLVGEMCELERDSREKNFVEVRKKILQGKFPDLNFEDFQIEVYRGFANGLSSCVSSIQTDSRFNRNIYEIVEKLEDLKRRTMLEEYLPATNILVRIFILGNFRYYKKEGFPVVVLSRFTDLLRGLSEQKRLVVLENLITRLEASERTEPDLDVEIPF